MQTFRLQLLACLYFCSLSFITHGQTPAYPQPENSMRVMTYNIRNARGLDDKTDYERIANIILKVSPEVVALQEIDSVTERSNKADVLDILKSRTQMHAVYGASIDYQGGKYGIGILSKEKPISWKRIPLPGKEEARSLLIVEFSKYIFCCSHFSLTEKDRLASAKIINKEAKAFKKPAFLAGDLNGQPDSPEIAQLAKSWKILNNPTDFTIPADKPDITIDFILGYQAKGQKYSVLQSQVLNEPVASDHLPVFVDVQFEK